MAEVICSLLCTLVECSRFKLITIGITLMTIEDRTTLEYTPQTRTLWGYVGLAARGFAMGAADVVPGVSGGTMAFILGIYEELITSIRTFGQPEFIQAVVQFRFKDLLNIVNWEFLLAIAVGIATAVLTLPHTLEWLFINQPIYLWSFFFGLVLASVITVSKRVEKWTPQLMGILAIGAILAFALVRLVPVDTPEAWWFLILSGAIASVALILPGISGAFILLILGKYQFVVNAVNERDIITIALVGIGVVIGLISFAQVLGWLFHKYPDLTVSLLIGLMIGIL